MRKKRSISHRFIISVLLIVATLVIIIIGMTTFLLSRSYDRQIRSEISNTSGFIVHAVEAFIGGMYNLSYELAVNPSILTFDAQLQEQILKYSVERNDYLELLYTQDTTGMQIARSSGELRDRSNRWWYTKMMAEMNPFVSQSYISGSTNLPCISVFIPMFDDKEFVGIFGTDINLKQLQNLMEQFSDYENGRYSFIIDGQGVVMSHPESIYLETLTNYKTLTRTMPTRDSAGRPIIDAYGDEVTEDVPIVISDKYKSIIESVMQGGTGVDEITEGGVDYFISYQSINLPGVSDSWSVITLKDKKMAMNSVTQLIIGVVAVSLVVALVALLLLIVMMRRITTPIGNLSANLSRIANGELDINVATNDNDEIGELSRDVTKVVDVFNELVNGLHGITDLHEKKGMTGERLDKTRFVGAYAGVVDSINDMLDYHTTSKAETLACIFGIVNGKFDTPIKQYPGEESQINESVEGLRTNIRRVVSEIHNVAEHAQNGNMNYAVNIEEYAGDWAKLMIELNGIMSTVHEPISEMVEDINSMERGDFSIRVQGDYKGDFLVIKETLNATIEAVSAFINDMTGVLSLLAKGDLRQGVTQGYEGQFASIKDSINMIVDTLSKIMCQLSEASGEVLNGAKQISESAAHLAQGAAEQEASVQELHSMVAEIDSQSKENSGNAQLAAEVAVTSEANAETGSKEMRRLLTAMEGITDSANKISDIIKIIEGIAFQTNLLALNASVEAARAGTHGKGFAVVADEVRNLALRSGRAANEMKALIEESLERVTAGTQCANDTSASLEKIVDNIESMAKTINLIHDSSAKQTDAVGRVGIGLEKISSVVQSNSAVSEESAATSQTLSVQAEQLKEMLSFFKLR